MHATGFLFVNEKVIKETLPAVFIVALEINWEIQTFFKNPFGGLSQKYLQ